MLIDLYTIVLLSCLIMSSTVFQPRFWISGLLESSKLLLVMISYMEPSLSLNPDGLIILCGTNNLRRERPDETANKIINLAVIAKRRVKYVAVSSIILRRDSQELDGKREEVNILLERELRKLGIDFIKHNNIRERDLDRYGLHLNTNGSKVLTGNFVDFLNKV